MISHQLAGAMASVLAGAVAVTPAFADMTIEQRVAQLERDNARQAAQIAEQQQALAGSPNRVKQLDKALEQGAGWFKGIEIAGLIEVEGSYIDPGEGRSESDLVLATFELGIAAQVNAWVRAEASLLYEEDDTDLEVDLAFIRLHNAERSPLFLTAGQFYLPFGVYDTNLVSDPLTLEIGETRETAAQFGVIYQGFTGSVYAFNGDNQVDGKNQIQSWGGNLGYTLDSEAYNLSVSAGYINDLGDSDTLQGRVAGSRQAVYERLVDGGDPRAAWFSTDPTRRTGGWTASLNLDVNGFNVIAEYLSASERFDADSLDYRGRGAEPAAWNIELGYRFPVFGRDSVVAAAYQGTSEAVNLELPEQSWLVGWSVEIFDRTALSLEYRNDTDYRRHNGGTGKTANAVVAQLAVEF